MWKWFLKLITRKKKPMKTKEYWESRHPIVQRLYNGRPLPNGNKYDIDVRHFVWNEDITLFELIHAHNMISENNDQTVQNIQKWVVNNLKYTSDETLGRSEYWLFPAETVEMLKGDCEDGAILIASMILCALPIEHHWRVRVCAGWVQEAPTAPQGGHGYVTYCRCSDNEWVVIDWCYLEDSRISMEDKPLHKNNKYYKDIWFSFNHKYAYSHTDLSVSGRVKDV